MHVVCFFFKQKTAYEMRMSDWSSDVCSSDLEDAAKRGHPHFIGKGRKIIAGIRIGRGVGIDRFSVAAKALQRFPDRLGIGVARALETIEVKHERIDPAILRACLASMNDMAKPDFAHHIGPDRKSVE